MEPEIQTAIAAYIIVALIGLIISSASKVHDADMGTNRGWSKLVAGWVGWPVVLVIWILWGFYNLTFSKSD